MFLYAFILGRVALADISFVAALRALESKYPGNDVGEALTEYRDAVLPYLPRRCVCMCV